MSLPTKPDRAARRLAKLNDPERLSAWTTFAWTTTGFSGASNIIVLSFLTIFATDALGLPPAIVGTLALITKLVEAVTVVIAGWLVDRSPVTRWGKARPYELAILGVWASTAALFATPDWDQTGKIIWVFFWMLMVNAVFTTLLGANDVLYLARTFSGRRLIAKVATRTGLFTVLGAVGTSVIFPVLLGTVGQSASGYAQVVLWVAIPMAIIGLGRFLFCPEKYDTEAPSENKLTFAEIREVLAGNPYIWTIATMAVVAAFSGGSGIAAYYFTYIVGDIALMGVMAIIPVLILPLMLIFPRLMAKMPVSRIISLGGLCGIIGGVILFFALTVGNGSLLLIGISSMIGGFGMLPITFLTQLLIIDNASYNEWLGKRRLESSMGAINAFAGRVGGGLGAAATGWILGLAGYDGTLATQPAPAITAIVLIASALPAALWALIIVLMWRYRKFEELLPQIQQDLAEKHAAQGLNAPDDLSEVDLAEDPISVPVPVSTASGVVATPLVAPTDTGDVLDELDADTDRDAGPRE